MGSDVYWDAEEPDVQRQKRAGWFIESFARENSLEYVAYNGPVTGYFLPFDALPHVYARKMTRHLIGVSIYAASCLKSDPSYNVAACQCSFVFDDTDQDSHPLITLEPITDFGWEKYSVIRPFFEQTPMDPATGLHGVYKEGASCRFLGPGGFLGFIFSLKFHLLPSLVIADDSGLSEYYDENPSRLAAAYGNDTPFFDPELEDRWR